jgi:hypothetical protein
MRPRPGIENIKSTKEAGQGWLSLEPQRTMTAIMQGPENGGAATGRESPCGDVMSGWRPFEYNPNTGIIPKDSCDFSPRSLDVPTNTILFQAHVESRRSPG